MSEPVREIVRLNDQSYAALEQKLPVPYVTDKTTDLQAAFALGVQTVLKILREGWKV